MPKYGSPTRYVWLMFGLLEGLCEAELEDASSPSLFTKADGKAAGILATFVAVNAVEAFLNCFFRVRAEEFPGPTADRVKKQLLQHFTLEKKITDWVSLEFQNEGRKISSISEDDPRLIKFRTVKNLRNSLMHFKSSHETKDSEPGIRLEGMANLDALDQLDPVVAEAAALGFIEAFFESRGFSAPEVRSLIHIWTGRLVV